MPERMKPAGERLQEILARFEDRRLPTEEELAEKERWREKAKVETNKVVYLEAYLKHLPDRLRRLAGKRPDEHVGNRLALQLTSDLVPGQNAFLYGPRGVGKTHLAVWTGARLIREYGLSCRFATFPAILDSFDSARHLEEAPPDWQHPEVLIVDDLDKGRTTAYASERFYELLYRFLSTSKTTIITCNRDPLATARLFYAGDAQNQAAMASRLMATEHVKLTGTDRRVKAETI
jgi:Cdc6-like AAA superfamily ATPase